MNSLKNASQVRAGTIGYSYDTFVTVIITRISRNVHVTDTHTNYNGNIRMSGVFIGPGDDLRGDRVTENNVTDGIVTHNEYTVEGQLRRLNDPMNLGERRFPNYHSMVGIIQRDMMLFHKHRDNDINHIVSTAILVIITFLNCYPASGHLMDLKRCCSQSSFNRTCCAALFVIFTIILLGVVLYTILQGVKAIKNDSHFGISSLVICFVCVLYNIVPTLLTAGVIFRFDVK